MLLKNGAGFLGRKVFWAQFRFVSQQLDQVHIVLNSKGQYVTTTKQNENFEHFYKKQQICSENEFPEFLESCRQGLPSVFRVFLHKPEAKLILSKLKGGAFETAGLSEVSWYPYKNTFRLKKTRWEFKEEKECHDNVNTWRNAGSIYRQEQVSMVPVACLDIEPHHNVLDMCAAPGSKTIQVLEEMHKDPKKIPSGFVIANEVDQQRCSKLAGNLNLFNSPAVALTSFKGQNFPDLKDEKGEVLLYDRIVCDVPCSGDGTIRKNPNVWNLWNPARGNHRSSLQLKIARRGVELLAQNGLMAYSSCSINQIENECVVAQLLKEFEGSLELVDMSHKFSGLRFEGGLATWCVFDKEMREYTSYAQVPETLQSQMLPYMFPDERNRHLNLERCMRFLPHYNDDGGFFVAILRKTANNSQSSTKRSNAKLYEGTEPTTEISRPVTTYASEPFTIMKKFELNSFGGSDLKDLNEYYGLDINTENVHHFAKEDGSQSKFVYYMNDSLTKVIKNNREALNEVGLLGAQLAKKTALKHPKTNYQLRSDAIWWLQHQLNSDKRRVVEVRRQDFDKVLSHREISTQEVSSELRQALIEKDFGLTLLYLEEYDMMLPIVSSAASLQLGITRVSQKSLCGLLNIACHS